MWFTGRVNKIIHLPRRLDNFDGEFDARQQSVRELSNWWKRGCRFEDAMTSGRDAHKCDIKKNRNGQNIS